MKVKGSAIIVLPEFIKSKMTNSNFGFGGWDLVKIINKKIL